MKTKFRVHTDYRRLKKGIEGIIDGYVTNDLEILAVIIIDGEYLRDGEVVKGKYISSIPVSNIDVLED